MKKRHKRKKRRLRANLGWRKKLLLSILVLIFALAIAEVTCQVLETGKLESPEAFVADWDSQNIGMMTADGQFHTGKTDDDSGLPEDFYLAMPGVDINSDGVRDREHEIEAKKGVVRIACLGDSTTFGYHLPMSQSYPMALERTLKKRVAVEVFNIGLPGWSCRQERIAYELIARKYKPDLVILGFCLNDVAEMQNNLTKPSELLQALYRRSALARVIMRPHAREIQRVEQLFLSDVTKTVANGWELCEAEVRHLDQLVAQDGGQLAVLILPFRFQVEQDAPEPLPQQRLSNFCQENGIPCIDSLSSLKELGGDAFVDYDHLSMSGCQRVADLLANSPPFAQLVSEQRPLRSPQ